MKIRSLQLKNIGVFEDETIHFPEKKGEGAEIHILTGQNGTGKTTILQALAKALIQIEPFNFYSHLYNNLNGFGFIKSFNKKISRDNFIYKVNFEEDNYIEFTQLGSSNYSYWYFTPPIIQKLINEKFDLVHKTGTPLVLSGEDAQKSKEDEYNQYRENGVNFFALAYTGYRFIENKENINISDNSFFDPVKYSLEFFKNQESNDYTLNQWLANTISKRNNAFFEGNKLEVEKYSKNIELLKQIIFEIIETPVDFKFKNEKAKIVAVKNGEELDFDLLPDGLRSIISWLGDLIMRMDALKWENDLDIRDREFILFLDEIEVHLHPYWQRKILPVVQNTFKNAQIFITTHSPFIVNSVDGAYIYELKLDDKGNCHCEKPQLSSTTMPIDEVLSEIYDIDTLKMYGQPIEKEIEDFQKDLKKAYHKSNDFNKKDFLKRAKNLASKSTDLRNNVQFELRQLSKNLAENFEI